MRKSNRGIYVGRAAIAALTGAGLVAFAVVALPGTARATDSSTAALTDSANLSTPIVAQGVLDDSTGAPVGSGAIVWLQALPTSAALNALQSGETLPITTVGYARTTAGGEFVLRYSDPAALAAYADPAGNVNLEVQSDDGSSLFYISRPAPAQASSSPALKKMSPAARTDLSKAQSATYPAITVKPIPGLATKSTNHAARAAVTATDTSTPDPTITDTPDPTSTDDSPVVDTTDTPTDGTGHMATPAGGGRECTTGVTRNIGNRYTVVGEAYTSGAATVSFSYKKESSSTIGVGVSASGAKGTFSASGTTGITNGGTVSFTPLTSGGARYRTFFYYKVIFQKCVGHPETYAAIPTSWSTGASSLSSSTPSATKCVHYDKGSGYTQDQQHAATFSEGVGISADIGINLSSQTGWNNSTSIGFTYSKSAGNLCGTHDYPGPTKNPQRLVAKN